MIEAIAQLAEPVTRRVAAATGIRPDLQLHFVAGLLICALSYAGLGSLASAATVTAVIAAAREAYAAFDANPDSQPDPLDFFATLLGVVPVAIWAAL